MSYTYTKSKINDFPNGLDSGLLHLQLETAIISTGLVSINTDDVQSDDVLIIFNSELDPSDEIIMNTIISAHVPELNKKVIQRTTPSIYRFATTAFQNIGRVLLKSRHNRAALSGIDIISYMDPTISSYTVQFVVRATNTILSDSTFTNTTLQINTMTWIGDEPIEDAIIDVLAKVVLVDPAITTGRAYVEEIVLWN